MKSILTLAQAQKFGKTGTTTHCNKSHWAKLANCDTPGIGVGFVEGNQVGTYCVFNPKTKNKSDKRCNFSGLAIWWVE